MSNILKRYSENLILNKSVLKNISHLSVLQILTLLIPLLTYPYLIHVIGKETYGLIVFTQGIINYFLILVGFGFNISATREISIYRDNREKLNEIVSSVLIIKILLLLVSFGILGLLLILFNNTVHVYRTLLLLTLAGCLGDVLFPIWYFQGIEKMKYITYITLCNRVIYLFLIFLFVKKSDEYYYIPIFNGLGHIIAGILALYIIYFKHNIKFSLQTINSIKYYFWDSISIFISNISVSIYITTNKVVAGIFLGMAEVSYYDLAEKLINIFKMPIGILSQSLFPKISKDRDISFIKRVFKFSISLNFLLVLLIFIFSKFIIKVIGGEEMIPTVIILNILALSIPIIAMSNVFGILTLLPFGYNKLFSKVIVWSGFFYLSQMIVIWITLGYSIINITVATVLTEIFVTINMFYFCRKNKLW